MVRTISGLVTDIVAPDDVERYAWGELQDYLNDHDAWLVMVRTETPSGILDRLRESTPWTTADNHAVVAVEKPSFRIDDAVVFDVHRPTHQPWYIAVSADEIPPARRRIASTSTRWRPVEDARKPDDDARVVDGGGDA
jgi:hypothetical protein